MQTLLVECVIRTSLIAPVVGLVLYVMRIRTASARHAVWAGVVGAISLEVFGEYGTDMLTEPGAIFDTQVRLLVGVLTQVGVNATPYRTSSPN